MKRFISLLVAALMLVSCASGLAVNTVYKEMGFAIDYSTIQDQTTNYFFLKNYGVMHHEPFIGFMVVSYTSLPRNVLDIVESIMDETKVQAEYDDYYDLLSALTISIGEIVVTDADSPAEAGISESIMEQYDVTEFATFGGYHYYFVSTPLDRLISFYDEAEDAGDYEISPQEMKATALADIELVRSELLKLLQSAECFEPVDTTAEFIGQTVEFESIDLDGNVVTSADLFRNNKITMVNLWGTWCVNCVDEMGKLEEIHKRMQDKGCGIVGVECESDPVEKVAEEARKVFEDNGITFPNVWRPQGNPVFSQVNSYPFSLFVDSDGRILTYPIRGAAVKDYEPTFEKLLAGEAIEDTPQTGAAENKNGEYRVFVYDTEGNPVKGAIVQFCDESTCSFQKTDADGLATFHVEAPKVFDVHVAKVPKGYQSSDETYRTLDTFCDVNIFINKAE